MLSNSQRHVRFEYNNPQESVEPPSFEDTPALAARTECVATFRGQITYQLA